MSKANDDLVTLTLTAREWRILIIAAAGVDASKYQDKEHAKEAKRLAVVIATETGKDDD